MKTYRVTWTIDIESSEAETPEQAAAEALKIQRDPDSMATVFTVVALEDEHTIDLAGVDLKRQLA